MKMSPERIRSSFTPYHHRKDMHAGREMESERRRCFCVSLVYLSAAVVSVAMIVVGALYAAPLNTPRLQIEASCKGEPMIPWYLIFGGVLTLALVLGRILIYKIVECCASKSAHADRPRRLACVCCRMSVLTLYDVLALAATALWLMAGTKFILGIWGLVNHKTEPKPNRDYCDPIVFYFSFWLMVVGWVFVLLMFITLILCRLCRCLCFLACCKPCRNQNDDYQI